MFLHAMRQAVQVNYKGARARLWWGVRNELQISSSHTRGSGAGESNSIRMLA